MEQIQQIKQIKKYLAEDKDRKLFYKTPCQEGRYIIPKTALLVLGIKDKKEFLQLTKPYSYMVVTAEIIKNGQRKLTSHALIFYAEKFLAETGSIIL